MWSSSEESPEDSPSPEADAASSAESSGSAPPRQTLSPTIPRRSAQTRRASPRQRRRRRAAAGPAQTLGRRAARPRLLRKTRTVQPPQLHHPKLHHPKLHHPKLHHPKLHQPPQLHQLQTPTTRAQTPTTRARPPPRKPERRKGRGTGRKKLSRALAAKRWKNTSPSTTTPRTVPHVALAGFGNACACSYTRDVHIRIL